MTDVAIGQTLGEYKDIDLIDPSPLNPRKTFHQERLRELAESAKAVGIIEPLVVRPGKGGRVEIVAGERRFRAAKIAGLTALPVVVKFLSDPQVLEIMAVENEQRDDIHPLERAAGYQALMKADGSWTIDVIAHRIGKSKRWVQLCLQYLTLIPEAQQAFKDGKITSGHADLLVRLHTPDDQRRALAACFEELRLIALPEAEQEQIDELRYADEQPAKKGKKKAPAVEIPSRLRSTRELADWIDTHIKADRQELSLEFPELQDALVEADSDGRKVIEISHLTRNEVNRSEYQYDQKQLASGFNEANKAAAATALRRVVFAPNWERADGQEESKPCEHSVLGVVTFGHGKGQQLQVCVAKKTCTIHWGDYQKGAKDRQRVYGHSSQEHAETPEQKAKREAAAVVERAKWERRDKVVRAAVDHLRKAKLTPGPAFLPLFQERDARMKTWGHVAASLVEEDLYLQSEKGWTDGAALLKPLGVDLLAMEKALHPREQAAASQKRNLAKAKKPARRKPRLGKGKK